MIEKLSSDKYSVSAGPLTIRPRFDQGDWGAQHRVLVETPFGATRLHIVPGHTAPVGARGWGRKYHKAALWLTNVKSQLGFRSAQILAEGRISMKQIAEHAALIDDTFGVPGLSQHIRLDQTITVVPVLSFNKLNSKAA